MAISCNILHSLRNNSTHKRGRYSSLLKLDEGDRLKNIVNRIVAYYNVHLTLEHLTEAISLPLPSMHSVYNLVDSNQHPKDKAVDNHFDSIEDLPEPIKSITQDYLNSLHITESIGEGITEAQMREIERYLKDIGLLSEVRSKTYVIRKSQANEKEMEKVIYKDNLMLMQPGMQYCIANELVNAVNSQSENFVDAVNLYRRLNGGSGKIFTTAKLNKVTESIRNKVRGNILENITLVEAFTATEKINSQVQRDSFGRVQAYKAEVRIKDSEEQGDKKKPKCDNQEVDLVIEDSRATSCVTYRLFEIKHSDKILADHHKFLVESDLHWAIEDHYGGKIIQRTVLYRGPSKILDNGVIYYNVEDFLCKLGEDPNFLVCDLKAEIQMEQQEKAEQEAELDACIDDPDEGTDWCER